MTYKKRNLKVQFTLKEGAFDASGNNVLTIENIKSEVMIGAYGGVQGVAIDLRVYGLSLEQMALLSYKGIRMTGAKMNMMKVWAGEDVIFYGSITGCFIDLNQTPDAPLIICGSATGYDQTVSAKPFSQQGSVDVSDVISSIAKGIGYTVINSGVDSKLSNPHFSGDPISQINQCVAAAGINHEIFLGSITIWPQTGKRDDVMPLISSESGLIGYPTFHQLGIYFNCVYSNLLVIGRQVKLETSLPNASGIYTIAQAEHNLSSWSEGGPWMTSVLAISTVLTASRT